MSDILRLENITKTFPGVKVLDNINLQIKQGEVHALLGENGAGKSTLLNIIHGVYPDYDGNIYLNGHVLRFRNTKVAIEEGIIKVHQEINIIPELNVAQNITLGYEKTKGLLIDYKTTIVECNKILKQLNCSFTSDKKVRNLNVGEMQMVAIAKALYHKAKVISFDEPTASLTNKEVDNLFDVIRRLKKEGITIIYVSHRLDEIYQICDRMSVLRDGQYIGTYKTLDLAKDALIYKMVGRDVSSFAKRSLNDLVKDDIVLEVNNISKNGLFKDISFNLRRGEILGFAGLVGSKRSDVMKALIGEISHLEGSIKLNNKLTRIKSAKDALRYGIGMLSEDRKQEGFVATFSNSYNIGLSSLDFFSKYGFISTKKNEDNASEYVKALNINPKNIHYYTNKLSGGNQQKVIIAKWISSMVDIIIFDEPTKGVDVGAKADIYTLMEKLLRGGKSIIMVSSELPEVIGMSDRIMVMREGRIVKELEKKDFSERLIMHFAMGGVSDDK